MSGWVAGAGLAGAALSTAGTLYASSRQGDKNDNSLYAAQMNYQLQKQIAEQQQRMAEAGRMDAAGNRTYFNGKDWVIDTTPATKGIISASQGNEREQQVKGGTRREFGQSDNFTARGNAGNEADAVLRMLRDRIGAPTLEGVRGRGAIAAATEVGGNRDTLVDAVSRNLIRSGGGGRASDRAIAGIDDGAARSLRTALAKNDAIAPEQHRVAEEGWATGKLNRFAPMQGVRSNLTDAPFTPTQAGTPIDASANQAATYGAATMGRNAGNLNTAQGLVSASPYTPMPWGSAFNALSKNVVEYLKLRDNNNDSILKAGDKGSF